ncbi:hypothetical protein SELMODRAFT_229918 [Selaginella moellendorffii]|uniref:L-ascorbate oxidase n=1 Tax=Selaginella moellendorffii TaxID=88036 RepID=D8QML5_SELML|nr:monocopper oxidase-like protein SKU5 [Selaginella moellendorffii]EFJ37957.1 hypothetical protein SELMODRAFT_229918 [Selaginella moellendorffii]|eukprot:XP_002960418.1 monocopper oxidase-like protein SKU5 [Selaginella moellendorffii]
MELRPALAVLVLLVLASCARGEDPYLYFEWNVSFVDLAPLGAPQRVIAINNQLPGPEIAVTTNNNLEINVFNSLDEPLLFTWNAVWMRRSSWQDGVLGTNCPIPPGANWTYKFQVKDQIGSGFYYPSLLMQRAAGGYGGIRIYNRAVIAVPFAPPAGDITMLIGDWYKQNHTALRGTLDAGFMIGAPDGVLINGRGPYGSYFVVEPANTYRLRISNVGISTTLNFRIEGHRMLLVETEGSYTVQNFYDSLDVHVGQSYSVIITTDQAPGDFHIVASSRFGVPVLTGLATLHYSNSPSTLGGTLPPGPDPGDVGFSFNQAWSIRWNLTAGAARPNPQGSFHYGVINVSRTIKLFNTAPMINGKQRFAVNDISYFNPDTPLKLADYYKIPGVFSLNSIPDSPYFSTPFLGTSVLNVDYHSFIEIIFQNNEEVIQSWHIDGYQFFVVGFGPGAWNDTSRLTYNLYDAVARSTTQVYPMSWTAIFMSLDNVGMWEIRSQNPARQYLGQDLYMRVYNPEEARSTETAIPSNVLRCGKAVGLN